MADFPYTQVVGKLKAFFEKIQQVGRPDNVDKKWLASIGLTASNDPSIVPVLKFVGFVDQSGKPTERWMAYRDKGRAGRVLAEGIRSGYADLFRTYPDAYRRSDDDLRAFFTTKTTAGLQVIAKTVATFKTLCELADFSELPGDAPHPPLPEAAPSEPLVPTATIQGPSTGITVNINIQLTLPATTDEVVYEKLFAAMKTYILS